MTIARYSSSFTFPDTTALNDLIQKVETILSTVPENISNTYKLIHENKPYMHIPSLLTSTLYITPKITSTKVYPSNSYYSILNSNRSDTTVELKRNYWRLARVIHPDKLGRAVEEEDRIKWKEVVEAWKVLREERKDYDMFLMNLENGNEGDREKHETVVLEEKEEVEDDDGKIVYCYSFKCERCGIVTDEIYEDEIDGGRFECECGRIVIFKFS